MFSCSRKRVRQGGRVALVSGVHLGRDHGAGVEVQSVLWLVGQTRSAILQLGDSRIRVGLAFPSALDSFLPLRAEMAKVPRALARTLPGFESKTLI
jgi:hypothetical protein